MSLKTFQIMTRLKSKLFININHKEAPVKSTYLFNRNGQDDPTEKQKRKAIESAKIT